MITHKELYPIGYVSKTHGIKGELNIQLDTDYNPEDFRFLVFEMESIFVPFEIVSSRGQGVANRLVALKGIETVEDARPLVGKTAFVLKRELVEHPDYNNNSEGEEEGLYLSDLIGYTVADETGKLVGKIIGFNDDTMNYLLELELPDGKTVFIPYVDDWVTELNQENKTISLNLPNGLLEA